MFQDVEEGDEEVFSHNFMKIVVSHGGVKVKRVPGCEGDSFKLTDVLEFQT